MNSIICKTHIHTKTPTKTIAISTSIMQHWKLKSGETILIKAGNKEAFVRIIRTKMKGKNILLSDACAKGISLPFTGNIRITYEEESKSLRFGPVIGILTTGYTKDFSPPFGVRNSLFKSFIRAGRSEGPLIFVFTPESIHWENQTIDGWYYNAKENSKWEKFTSPFPDVVYERIPNRKAESQPHVQQALHRLRARTNIKVFNQGFFNKWYIHQLISDHPITGDFVPETYLAPSIQTLKDMLETHKMIYLKPNKGSLGLGIFRITRQNNEFYCRFHQGEKNVLHRFKSLEKLIKLYFGVDHSRLNHYLAQQGIRLIKYEGRTVDFRVHMHKDKEGSWQIVATGAKTAGSGCVTTHVRTGGCMVSTDQLLEELFGEDADLVQSNIQNTAIAIAETLESQIDGPLGELGMDIGVDIHGDVWLFEVNSKPGRHIFHHQSLKKAGLHSAKYITDYSLNLANFV